MATSSPSGTPVTSGSVRRRGRSGRVTAAVAFLLVATATVLVVVPTQSPGWLTFAAVLTLAFGWAAARTVHNELAQARRDHAVDRAVQAHAYREAFAERAVEHALFTSSMLERLRRADAEMAELQEGVVAAQRRAAEAESRAAREEERADAFDTLVAELGERVRVLEAEQATDPQHAGGPADTTADQLVEIARDRDAADWDGFETVVDLMAWEEKVGAITKAALPPERKHA